MATINFLGQNKILYPSGGGRFDELSNRINENKSELNNSINITKTELINKINEVLSLASQANQFAMDALPRSWVSSSDAIDIDTWALSAKQNNPHIGGTLRHEINKLLNSLTFFHQYEGVHLGFPQYPVAWIGQGFTVITVGDTEEAKYYSPLPSYGGNVEFNVLTFGSSNPTRVTQLAFYGFLNQGSGNENCAWVRTQHDQNVSDWKKIY
ncbi:MAG: hypothetical protein K2L48_03220 [Mycoplasmoidaceae bacterium]|nr:hypothetical protein [Mycoplasmoidaceae bacterium]